MSASNGPSLSPSGEAAGHADDLVFAAAALFVFLCSPPQYESWKTPLSIVLILPHVPSAPQPAGLQFARHADRHSGADRFRRARGPRCKERDPPSWSCSPTARRGESVARKRRSARRSTRASSSDPDDVLRLHFGRRCRSRPRRAPAPRCGNRWDTVVFGMLGVTDLRSAVHAGLLRDDPALLGKEGRCGGGGLGRRPIRLIADGEGDQRAGGLRPGRPFVFVESCKRCSRSWASNFDIPALSADRGTADGLLANRKGYRIALLHRIPDAAPPVAPRRAPSRRAEDARLRRPTSARIRAIPTNPTTPISASPAQVADQDAARDDRLARWRTRRPRYRRRDRAAYRRRPPGLLDRLVLVDTIAYDSFPRRPAREAEGARVWDTILGAPDFNQKKASGKALKPEWFIPIVSRQN